MVVKVWQKGSVGLVTLDAQPVNAIDQTTQQGLFDAVRWAEDAKLTRVILTGVGRSFSVGLEWMDLDAEPIARPLVDAIAQSPVPWIAAINGDAFGAGAEIAMACRMRIIVPSAKFGLKRAVSIVTPGNSIDANSAKDLGWVDAISDDPVKAAQQAKTGDLARILPTSKRPSPEIDNEVVANSPAQIAVFGDRTICKRILARYHEAADTVFMDGSTPWEVDEAMEVFGFAMGPYETQDLTGLDIAHAERRKQDATRDPNRRYIPIADRMIELGKLGRKTGAGWYRYPGGGGSGKVEDPIVADLAIEESHFAGTTRTDYAPEEITERLLLAMINEAADMLHEGIAQSAKDIDLVSVHKCGFPQWRGGLMQYADTLGVAAIVARLEALATEDPITWRISPLLKNCAADVIPLAQAMPGQQTGDPVT